MACIYRYWQVQTGTGRYKQGLADIGGYWQVLVKASLFSLSYRIARNTAQSAVSTEMSKLGKTLGHPVT